MAPSFLLSPLSAQNVVLEDQRLIAQCNICCENYGPTRKGYKCSAGDPACQYPACEPCWSQIADGACPHCRRFALPYFDRQLTESTDACVITCQNAAYGCSWQGHYGKAQAHLEDECDALDYDVRDCEAVARHAGGGERPRHGFGGMIRAWG